MSKRLIWELFLLSTGIIYVVIALCDSVQSLPFVLVFVALAAQELARARGRSSKENDTNHRYHKDS